jgi:hypothetical protein
VETLRSTFSESLTGTRVTLDKAQRRSIVFSCAFREPILQPGGQIKAGRQKIIVCPNHPFRNCYGVESRTGIDPQSNRDFQPVEMQRVGKRQALLDRHSCLPWRPEQKKSISLYTGCRKGFGNSSHVSAAESLVESLQDRFRPTFKPQAHQRAPRLGH